MTHNSPILRTHEDVRIVKVRSFSNYGTGMSLGIVIKGPDGIVLAADSRVTLSRNEKRADGTILVQDFHYDNSHKLLHFSIKDDEDEHEHGFVGAVTYGAAVIPNTLRTAYSFFNEFETTLILKSGEDRKTVEEYATALSRFYLKLWQDNAKPDHTGGDMVFIVAGYDVGEAHGRVFVVSIPTEPNPVEQKPGEDFGMVWGGQLEVATRLIHGFDPQMVHYLGTKFGLDYNGVQALFEELRTHFQYRIPYQVLPLQDCVDLAIHLIRTTAGIQSLAAVPRGVGGMIEVATISRTNPLRFVQKKVIHGET